MTQPFNIEDLYEHKKILEVDCIDQAEAAIGAVQTVDRGADSYATNLWHFPFDGTRPRQLTQGKGTNESPRWAPDGSRWAFLSDRAGSTQIFMLDGANTVPGSCSTCWWHAAPPGFYRQEQVVRCPGSVLRRASGPRLALMKLLKL